MKCSQDSIDLESLSNGLGTIVTNQITTEPMFSQNSINRSPNVIYNLHQNSLIKIIFRKIKSTHVSIIENETDFFEQVQVLFGKMLGLDPVLWLFSQETTTEDISIQVLSGQLSETREKNIIQQTASK